MANKLIPYRADLRAKAKHLRKNSTLSEVLLWKRIKGRVLGVQFHRQVPMLDYIVDFYCHKIGLAIEIDGSSHDEKFFYDAKRQGRIEKEGVHFLRFTNIEVKKDIFNVLKEIKEKIEESMK